MQVAKIRQTQEIKAKVANYELLEDILHSIKDNIESNKALFAEYVKAGRNEGLSDSEIWKLAKEILSTHIAQRTLYDWAHQFLSKDAFMLSKQIAVSHRKNVNVAELQQTIQQQNHIHNECESCAEAYEIDKVKAGVYTYEYLQSVCCWLHEFYKLSECRLIK